MGGTSRRILCVIAPERFRDEELAEPKRALEAAGHRVTVASTRPGHATGMLGARVAVDAVVAQGRLLAAICLAPPVLARAGVLAGKRATAYPAQSAIIELKRGGATYVVEPVVRDGTIVTASGPEAAAAFGAALATLLES